MSRIILNTKIWLFVLLFGMSFPAWAQSLGSLFQAI